MAKTENKNAKSKNKGCTKGKRCAAHKKRPGGKPEHRPTKKNRDLVTLYAVGEVPQDIIADILKISKPTLRKHYRSELDTSPDQAKATIISKVYTQAESGCVKSQRLYLSRVAHLENLKATRKVEINQTTINANVDVDREPKTAEEAAQMHKALMESLKHDKNPDTLH